MSRWRIALIVLLVAGPVALLAAVGSYHLWQSGFGLLFWIGMTVCLGVGYSLGWHWMRKKQLLPKVEFDPPSQWTERDKEAWKLVVARANQIGGESSRQFNEVKFYADLAQEMAEELAHFYHPKSKDPIGSLTVPEVLAVVELAAHDLTEMVQTSVPAGHLLTIDQWRWAKDTATTATKWYRAASNAYWIGSILLDPITSGVRYAASQAGLSRPMQMFQQDLVAWFHSAFIHRLGSYLIDLYSGRLKVGAQRYRELMQPQPQPQPAGPSPAPDDNRVQQITITVLGQTKVGKSSLVNALLGDERAKTDVVPITDDITRYHLEREKLPADLVILDTPGYAHLGPKADHLRATQDAARKSDVLLLVLHARNPGREADLGLLKQLDDYFAKHQDLKMPPVIAVVTHIDLLSPAMEWSPPYNWNEPQRPKGVQIQESLAAVHEQLGQQILNAVPVCTESGKVYGIEEWLLPVILKQLGEAKGVALLRTLRAEADAEKVRKVFRQLASVGSQALDIWLNRKQV